MYANFVGSGEQTPEVINGEVNGQERKDDTIPQIVTTEPVNGVQHEEAGEHIKYLNSTCISIIVSKLVKVSSSTWGHSPFNQFAATRIATYDWSLFPEHAESVFFLVNNSYSQPIRFVRFDRKSRNHRLPVLDLPTGHNLQC